jgi:hypothetical protein
MKKIVFARPSRSPLWFKILMFPILLLASAVCAPMLLAFPYHAQFGQTEMYSVQPIHPRTAEVIARADHLVARSPLYKGPFKRLIYLDECSMVVIVTVGLLSKLLAI